MRSIAKAPLITDERGRSESRTELCVPAYPFSALARDAHVGEAP